MKAYKGFNPDMTCRGFQYEEGKEYTHDGEVKCCEGGFHACEYPLDCFDYYAPADSVYHEVELSGTIDKEEQSDSKVTAQKIKVGARLDIAGMVKAAVDFTFARAKKVKGSSVRKTQGAASSTGNYGAASSTGDQGAASSTGYQGAASSTGYQGAASSTGNYGAASSTGDQGAASSTGTRGAASSTGYQGAASSTGYQGAASSTGDQGAASSTGYRGAASSTGTRGAASAGNPTAIAIAWGRYGKAKGVKGAHIVLAEWGEWNGKEYPLIGAKMAVVDGETIKEDTYYTLKNGELVEVE